MLEWFPEALTSLFIFWLLISVCCDLNTLNIIFTESAVTFKGHTGTAIIYPSPLTTGESFLFLRGQWAAKLCLVLWDILSNFVGSKFGIILICNEQMLVYMFVGMLIPVQRLPTKAMKIGPPQWWFHSTCIQWIHPTSSLIDNIFLSNGFFSWKTKSVVLYTYACRPWYSSYDLFSLYLILSFLTLMTDILHVPVHVLASTDCKSFLVWNTCSMACSFKSI